MALTLPLDVVTTRGTRLHGPRRSGRTNADESHADQCVTWPQRNVVRHEQRSIVPPTSALHDLVEDDRSVMPDFEAIRCGRAFADDGLAHVRRNIRQLFLAPSSTALDALGAGGPRET